MSETRSQHKSASIGDDSGAGQFVTAGKDRPAGRKRRVRNIVLVCVAVVLVGAGTVALGGFFAVRHLEANIHRIPGVFTGLAVASRPQLPAVSRNSMTILLTGSPTLPALRGGSGVDHSSTSPEDASGLITLVHINANGKAGALVSIPPTVLVHVPGHGLRKLDRALQIGGPSLLIGTVEQLTRVRIDHYSVVDFSGVDAALGPLGGVNVQVPDLTVSNGVTFHPGTNHLTAATAIDYVGQASLSEEGRVLRQQALLRAVLDKIAQRHLLSDPLSAYSTLNAFTKALSVDSNFTNSALRSLALHLRLLGAGSGTFVTAPVRQIGSRVTFNGPVSRQLWNAIRGDAVAAFARRHPATVTSTAPR